MECARKHVPTPLRGEISSYLESLYQSVAEFMPDSASESGEGDADFEVTCDCEDKQLLQQTRAQKEVRKLPPGSMYEQWRQYKELGHVGGYKVFWKTWTEDFNHLKFRRFRSHAICSVCLKHRLMIKHLSGDIRARVKQRHLFDLHLKAQYRDRQRYWHVRSIARTLTQKVLCLTVDAVDQAKFAWPRSFRLDAKCFEKYQRPRSHIYGGFMHGLFTVLTISHADVTKGSLFTADMLGWMLTTASHHFGDLSDYTVHILLDNASGSNKNNCIFAFCAILTALGLILETQVFLTSWTYA